MKYLFILAYICGFCICLYQCIKDELKTKDVINLGELAMMIFISIFSPIIGIYYVIVAICYSDIWKRVIIKKKKGDSE
jgi:hypothetical protein